MFFESRAELLETHPLIEPIRETFAQGHTRLALEQLKALPDNETYSPEDYMFYAEVERSCGAEKRFRAVIRWLYNRWPDNPFVHLQWIRVISMQGRLLEAYKLISKFKSPLIAPSLVDAIRASVISQIGCSEAFLPYAHNAIKNLSGDPQDDLVYYELCYAAIVSRNWDKAVKWGELAIAHLPRWPRLHTMLARAYLACDESERAITMLKTFIESGVEDITSDHMFLIVRFAKFEWEALRVELDFFQSRWGQYTHAGIHSLHILANWWTGNEARAVELARDHEEWCAILNSKTQNKERKFIQLPCLNQEMFLCVPTSVTLAAAAQGHLFSPRKLYAEMQGHQGTSLWKMTDIMQHKGFRVHIIELSMPAIKAAIDAHLPVIVPQEGYDSSHVQVIIGYDCELNGVMVRDPEDTIPFLIKLDPIPDSYARAGSYGIVLEAPDSKNLFHFQNINPSMIGSALMQLSREVSLGDAAAARLTFETIPNDHPVALHKNSIGYGVALSPSEFVANLKQILTDVNQPLINRLRCLQMAGDTETLERVNNSAHGSETIKICLWGFHKNYFNFQKAYLKNRWENALKIVNGLLTHTCSITDLWIKRAEILIETGQIEEARSSMRWAELIDPLSLWLRNKVNIYFPNHQTYQDRLNGLRSFQQQYPFARGIKQAEVEIFAHGPNGLDYEQVLLHCCQRQPRVPEYYHRLIDWYLRQNRIDLAQSLATKARTLLSVEEFPFYDFETEKVENELSTQKNTLKLKNKSDSDPSPKLAQDWIHAAANAVFNNKTAAKNDYWEALNALQGLDKNNKLQWHEQVDMIALKIIRASHDEKEIQQKLTAILPEALPGRLPYSLNLLCERLPILDMSPANCQILISWMSKQLNKTEWSEDLMFHFALLKEQANQLNEAEKIYREILKLRPGFGGAAYRLGCLCELRSDWIGAAAAYQQTLTANPGNTGALERLVYISRMGYCDLAPIELQERLLKLTPYDFNRLAEWVEICVELKNTQKIETIFEHAKIFFTEDHILAMRARVEFETGDFAAAQLKTQRQLFTKDKSLLRHFLITQYESAEQCNASQWMATALKEAEKQFPGDLYFLEKIGLQYFKRGNNTEAADYFQRVIINQFIHPIFVYHYLHATSSTDLSGIERLITSAPIKCQTQLIEAIGQVLRREGNGQLSWLFNEYVDRTFPEQLNMRAQHAQNLVMTGHHQQAVRIAEDLKERDPTNITWDYLLGFCYQDLDPKKSIAILEKHYTATGSIDSLMRIARGHQISGNPDKARATYYQCLQQAPLDDLILTNLIVLGDAPGRYFDAFHQGIEAGIAGDQSQYYLVSAIMSALEVKKQLPMQWGRQAELRFQQLLHEEPFRDERSRLARALYCWHRLHKNRDDANHYLRYLPGGRFNLSLLFWPGYSWIPRSY